MARWTNWTASCAGALVGFAAIFWAGCSEYAYIKHEGDDSFFQVEAGEVDVLLVVDNSCSMQPYQQELSEHFDYFLTYFIEGDVDYQIGVVTTSVTEPIAGGTCSESDVAAVPDAGELVDGIYITSDDDNGEEIFSDLVSVGICGSGYEMGLESAFRAVSSLADTTNAGFLREEAYLSIIFVSDEEDASPQGVNDYINAFREVKGQRSRDVFNASSLVVTDEEECTASQLASGATQSERYVDVAEQTEGVIGNICAEDFTSIVTELSLASSRLTDTFYLSQLPAASSLVVGIDGEEITCDTGEWTYVLGEYEGEPAGTIVFDREHMPPPSSRITAVYDLGDGDEADFCLGASE